jgi:hypothetical protein
MNPFSLLPKMVLSPWQHRGRMAMTTGNLET